MNESRTQSNQSRAIPAAHSPHVSVLSQTRPYLSRTQIVLESAKWSDLTPHLSFARNRTDTILIPLRMSFITLQNLLRLEVGGEVAIKLVCPSRCPEEGLRLIDFGHFSP
ncbi:hypothetical protein KY284_023207 [Solanum tuberosum]|nr:hypothetical protein KY284_023207 [Solanum tuberosum]